MHGRLEEARVLRDEIGRLRRQRRWLRKAGFIAWVGGCMLLGYAIQQGLRALGVW